MRSITTLIALTLAAGAATAAEDRVQVRYVDVGKFADFGDSSWDRERNEKDFSLMLQELGKRLPAGQRLSLEIRDVNLAGESEWWRTRNPELRVMRDVTWPMVELRYTLSAGGQVIKQGEARVSDLNYLHSSFFPSAQRNDRFAYEQRMLERWMKDELLR